MIEDFELFPLPPPWRHSPTEMTYINEDTGEVTTIHPYQRVLDKRAAATSTEQAVAVSNGQTFKDDLGVMREDSAGKRTCISQHVI